MDKRNLSLHSVEVSEVIECEAISFPPNVRNTLIIQQIVKFGKCIVIVLSKMSATCRTTANYSQLDS